MTQEERETINRRIFAWLNPKGCWHKPKFQQTNDRQSAGHRYYCEKCNDKFISQPSNPDYTSWYGMRLLLEWLTKRPNEYTLPKYWVRIEFHSSLCIWVATIGSHVIMPMPQPQTATDDTLPPALAQATLKLIEQEEKDA